MGGGLGHQKLLRHHRPSVDDADAGSGDKTEMGVDVCAQMAASPDAEARRWAAKTAHQRNTAGGRHQSTVSQHLFALWAGLMTGNQAQGRSL